MKGKAAFFQLLTYLFFISNQINSYPFSHSNLRKMDIDNDLSDYYNNPGEDDTKTPENEPKTCSIEQIVNNRCNDGFVLFTQYNDVKNFLLNNQPINQPKIIITKNIFIQYSTIQYQMDLDLKFISSINFGSCESKLRAANPLVSSDPLILLKADITTETTQTPYVLYEIFDPRSKASLNLDVCNDNIIINSPVFFTKEMEKIYQSLTSENIDLFNSKDDFYQDICFKYTTIDDTDITIDDRRKLYFKPNENNYMCQKGCEFEMYNYTTQKAKCNCPISDKTINDLDTSNGLFDKRDYDKDFYNKVRDINFKVMKCAKEVFDSDYKKNIGSFILMGLTVLVIGFNIFSILTCQKKINFWTSVVLRRPFDNDKIKKPFEYQERDPNKNMMDNNNAKMENKEDIYNIKNEYNNDKKEDNLILNDNKSNKSYEDKKENKITQEKVESRENSEVKENIENNEIMNKEEVKENIEVKNDINENDKDLIEENQEKQENNENNVNINLNLNENNDDNNNGIIVDQNLNESINKQKINDEINEDNYRNENNIPIEDKEKNIPIENNENNNPIEKNENNNINASYKEEKNEEEVKKDDINENAENKINDNVNNNGQQLIDDEKKEAEEKKEENNDLPEKRPEITVKKKKTKKKKKKKKKADGDEDEDNFLAPPKKSRQIKSNSLNQSENSQQKILNDKNSSNNNVNIKISNNNYKNANSYSDSKNKRSEEKLDEDDKKTEILEDEDSSINLSNYELDNLDYKKALELDKRSYLSYYWSLCKRKELILFAFWPEKDLNIFTIKLVVFISAIGFCFGFNGFFYGEKLLHKVYKDKGTYTFVKHLPYMIYSTILAGFLSYLIRLLTLSENEIYKMKQSKENKDKTELKAKKMIKIKLIIFFAVTIVLMLFFWYFITCFCGIFTNTQVNWIIDSCITFGFCMVYPFILNLIPGAFRIPALRARNKDQSLLYKISLYIAYI